MTISPVGRRNSGWRGPPLSSRLTAGSSGPGYLVRGQAAFFEPSEASSSGRGGMKEMAEGGMFRGSRQPLYPRNGGNLCQRRSGILFGGRGGGGMTIR